MIRRLLTAAAVLAVLAVVAGAGAGYVVLRKPAAGGPVELTVDPGSTTTQIARSLESKRVIGSALGFRAVAKVRGLDGQIRAGRYELRIGMGTFAALDALAAGPIEKVVRVTIPEGFTVKQVASRVGARTKITEADFLAAVSAGAARSAIQPNGRGSLEGFLFPETYVVSEKETAAALLSRMVRTFDDRTSGLSWSYAASKGLQPYQALVLASLVEREAKVPEDRGKIAGVIYNRLAKGMKLQIDATVLYDLPEHKVPTKRDLERVTPYNTYLNAGLPPTPIANPGLDAIRAALEPAQTTAIYYVVIDPSGKHGFADTFEEFQKMLKLRPPETTGRNA